MKKGSINALNRIIISVLVLLLILISSVSAEGKEVSLRYEKETGNTALPSRFRPILIVSSTVRVLTE